MNFAKIKQNIKALANKPNEIGSFGDTIKETEVCICGYNLDNHARYAKVIIRDYCVIVILFSSKYDCDDFYDPNMDEREDEDNDEHNWKQEILGVSFQGSNVYKTLDEALDNLCTTFLDRIKTTDFQLFLT